MKSRRVEINFIPFRICNGEKMTCSSARIADVRIIRNIDKLQSVRFNQEVFVDLIGRPCANAIGTAASHDEILVSIIVKVDKCVAMSISALLEWKCVRLRYELEILVEVECRYSVMVSYQQVIHPVLVYVGNHNGKGVRIFAESHFLSFVCKTYAWLAGIFGTCTDAQERQK